ncbi:hypothetical protein F8M41_017881 [Gigaspora margarita]|uniref:Uncharacterized protein n=1 Tax=Gigaspora margarita TaxID=4874 RepID=A0A8H4ELQ6_GIGMA|nr:hypothetical protein F8M41_017881 [Gigaspora margarita]
MGPNFVFYDGDIKIDKSLETSIDWIKIAWIEDEKLKLKFHQENDQKWNELVSHYAPPIPLSYLPYLFLLSNVSYESSEFCNVTTKFQALS